MIYDIPVTYSINPDISSLIEQASKCSGTCNDGGKDCSSNGSYEVDE